MEKLSSTSAAAGRLLIAVIFIASGLMKLSAPAVISDMKQFKKLNIEYKELQGIVEVYHEYKKVIDNIEQAKHVLANEKDKDFLEMAKAELEEKVAELARHRRRLATEVETRTEELSGANARLKETISELTLARSRRTCEPGKISVPRQYESRDPHADEWRDRHDVAAT